MRLVDTSAWIEIFRRPARNLDRAPADAVLEIEKIKKIVRFIARQVRHQATVKNNRLPGEDIDHRPDIVGFDLEGISESGHGSAQPTIGVHHLPLLSHMRHGGATTRIALRWPEGPDENNRQGDQKQ